VKRLAVALRSALLWGAGLAVFIPGALAIIIVCLFPRGWGLEWLIKRVCRSILTVCRVRVRLAGLENIDPSKQYLLMMNHVNIFDPLMFYAHFPGKARGVEEESHFRWPLYGFMERRIGNIPISRRSGLQARQSMQRAGALIRQKPDFSFIVLPEGTRTLSGKLGPFKRGGFLLAQEAGLEILPIIQKGAFAVNNKNSWHIRPGRVELLFEKPIPASGGDREDTKTLMDEVRGVFLRHLE